MTIPFDKGSPTSLEAGQRMGPYRLVRRLGEGGMGEVFEAVQEDITRRVAIKLLRQEFSFDIATVSRFLSEGRAVNIVGHPGVVGSIDCGRLADGRVYIVMEYVDGETLSVRLQKWGAMPIPTILPLARQLAIALAAAHAKKIIHRDLKPDNIMLVQDDAVLGGERARILDFGIAKVADEYKKQGEPTVRTAEGTIMGTPTHMAPEQFQDAAHVDTKADVYSLGVTLYQMAAGRLPFEGTLKELLWKHISEPPPLLSSVCPAVPLQLTTLVHAMMAKPPTERPAIGEVVMALDQLAAALGPDYQHGSSASPQHGHRSIRWFAGAALVLTGGLAIVALRQAPPPSSSSGSLRSWVAIETPTPQQPSPPTSIPTAARPAPPAPNEPSVERDRAPRRRQQHRPVRDFEEQSERGHVPKDFEK